MSAVLFAHTWRSQRVRLAIASLGLAVWGLLFPIIYATFGVDLQRLMESGQFGEMFEVFSRFTGGSVFSLEASLALGFVHPITIAVVAIFAVGFPVASIAGERQRGTLEVLLARPLDRRSMFVTLLLAAFVFVALLLAAIVAGAVLGALAFDVADELEAGQLAAAWLNAVALYGAFAAIAFAASVSFDRLAPALGAVLAVIVASYAVDVLAKLWPDARDIGPLSLFHYFPATDVLARGLDPGDLVVLGVVGAVAVGYALVVFPRRDLAAPS